MGITKVIKNHSYHKNHKNNKEMAPYNKLHSITFVIRVWFVTFLGLF